jgi:molybdopterin molybdotransferase
LTPSVEAYTKVDFALAQVLAAIRNRKVAETLPPWLAFGRVSAEDVLAASDIPEYPTAHWDGYAAISADLEGAGEGKLVSLRVVGAASPGERPRISISHGTAFQVATGAGLPSSADTVVPRESVEVKGGHIVVKERSPPGNHIYRAGEDLRKGAAIVQKGRALRAQDVGLLIATGNRKVKVWSRPMVSVLATGSELAAASRPERGKVVNSHSPVFLNLCERLGCEPVDEGIVKDDRTALSKKLRAALARSDLLLTLGGTSAGERDYVTAAITGLRPQVLVHGIKMDRGRVAGISVVKGKPIVMMPGPIQGAVNAFLLLALPVIEVLSGTRGKESELLCSFGGTWEARRKYADFRKVVYVRLSGGPRPTAEPLLAETESMKMLSDADGYIVVPESVTRMEDGVMVPVKMLPGFSFV